LFTAAIAILEVSLFGFLGELVDLLTANTPDTFWEAAGQQLIVMALILLIALPLSVLIHSMLIHQTLLGNYPMMIRWQAHRYLLVKASAFIKTNLPGALPPRLCKQP